MNINNLSIKQTEDESAVCILIEYNELIKARYALICDFLKEQGYMATTKALKIL